MKLRTAVRASTLALLTFLMPSLASHVMAGDGKTAADPNALDTRGEIVIASVPTGPTAVNAYTFSQSTGTLENFGSA